MNSVKINFSYFALAAALLPSFQTSATSQHANSQNQSSHVTVLTQRSRSINNFSNQVRWPPYNGKSFCFIEENSQGINGKILTCVPVIVENSSSALEVHAQGKLWNTTFNLSNGDINLSYSKDIVAPVFVTVKNLTNQKTIYSGQPINWVGIICNNTECKNWE